MTYHLGLDAISDFDDITDYTLRRWGIDAVNIYNLGLKKKLNSIGQGNEIKRLYNRKKYPDLYVTRYRFHLIYYLAHMDKVPIIVRILHHKRDQDKQLLKWS